MDAGKTVFPEDTDQVKEGKERECYRDKPAVLLVGPGRDQQRYRHDSAFKQDGDDLDKSGEVHGSG